MTWVDRRFYRSRYDSERVLEEFGRSLMDEVDVDQLTDEVVTVVIETMSPSFAAAWIRGPSGDKAPENLRAAMIGDT